MTMAFAAEVDTALGTRYIGKKGRNSKIPFFFSSAAPLKEIFKANVWAGNGFGFSTLVNADQHVRVIVVDQVEKGLRASTGANLSIAEFMAKEYSTSKYAPTAPSNAVFKIALDASGRNRKRYAGGGKYGKTWESQGHVRNHITNNIQRITSADGYYISLNACVMMIELDPDGITPKKITQTPIIEWYRKSPTCARRLDELTRTSLSDMNGDLSKLSPYA